ncbi:MAG: methionine-R-sulfoxide reductase [Bacteroidota bacterium]
MKEILFFCLLSMALIHTACSQSQKTVNSFSELPQQIENPEAYNKLSDEEAYVILQKGTEYPGTGMYNKHKGKGTYICKQCNAPLFRSEDKFDSGTGWPSYDDTIGENVKELPDADGRRVEIVCNNCDGHLGHVFRGEGFTEKMTRHCVNSVSLNFVEEEEQ